MATSTAALVVSIVSLVVSGLIALAGLAFAIWRYVRETADKAAQAGAERYTRYAAGPQQVNCGRGGEILRTVIYMLVKPSVRSLRVTLQRDHQAVRSILAQYAHCVALCQATVCCARLRCSSPPLAKRAAECTWQYTEDCRCKQLLAQALLLLATFTEQHKSTKGGIWAATRSLRFPMDNVR